MKDKREIQTRPFTVYLPPSGDEPARKVAEIDVEFFVDSNGEEILTEESLAKIDETQARHAGLMTPEEIVSLRTEKLNLTQDAMSELIRCGKKSLSRWENGRSRPTPLVNIILRSLADGELTVEYLRNLQKPRVEWVNFARGERPISVFQYRFAYQSGSDEVVLPNSLALA